MKDYTRRQFLGSLIPSWLTWRRVLLGLRLALFLFVALLAWRILSAATLRGALLLCKVAIVLATYGALVVLLSRALERASPLIRALVRWGWTLCCVCGLAAVGYFLYGKWTRGEEVAGVVISIGVALVLAGIDRWNERRRTKDIEQQR
jgi:xanthine/uracil permease